MLISVMMIVGSSLTPEPCLINPGLIEHVRPAEVNDGIGKPVAGPWVYVRTHSGDELTCQTTVDDIVAMIEKSQGAE